MAFKRVFVLAGAFILWACGAQAYCPEGCHDNGKCGPKDRCTCWTRANGEPQFTGADCSQYTCPKGPAWVAKAKAKDDAHFEVECSNVGYCDRSTGQCICKPGFSGGACQRMDEASANYCSHNGIWVSQATLAAEANKEYTTWAKDSLWGCKCDIGRRGHDCSQIECPSGEDVLGGPDAEEGRDCSGRGKCDYTTGKCQCFPGYDGQACSMQANRF